VGIQLVRGDLVSSECPLEALLANCEVIFNCAGEIRDNAKMRSLHVDATRRMLEAAQNQSEKSGREIHWVQLSSVGAYGSAQPGADWTVTEETETNPVGEYETTKCRSDELLQQACEDSIMTYSIVRPSNVFGRDMPNRSLHALGAMIRKKLFFYIGKPGAIATYVHVDDVIEVMLRCAFDHRAQGEIFNVSNDCALEELVNGIADALEVAPPKLRLPETPIRAMVSLLKPFSAVPLTQGRINALVSRTSYPSQKLESHLDYRPRIPVPGSIADAL